MTADQTLVIIGASLAGASAATGARDKGFDGRIVLIGEEKHVPYERPPLSKSILRGEATADSAQVEPPEVYAAKDIELHTGQRVESLATHAREVTLAGGERIKFSHLVIATGASPRRLDVPRSELDGVHHLRTIDDARRLTEALSSKRRVVIIGAGWIGAEVAASARQMGNEVVLVDPASAPLERVLGTEVGTMFADLHQANGVQLRLGQGVTELRGVGQVREVVLSDGTREPADVVVVGIGVKPRIDLARDAGLTIADGIVVGEHLETSVPGVFAAGDVASAWHAHYGRHLRVEHWANALNQGTTAGANVAGAGQAYDRIPYFFSDQFDLGMEYFGYGQPDDTVTFRGDRAGRDVIVFWQRHGMVTAAMNVNVWDVGDDLRALVASKDRVDPQRLADPDIALSDLARPT